VIFVMRSVVLFSVFLALTAFLLSVSAQPRRENVIMLYNDSACTEHIDTIRLPERNTTRCEVDGAPLINASSRLECADRNNVTHLIFDIWNDTTTCNDKPLLSMLSSAPAHTCAPVAVTFESNKSSLYAHIECVPPNMTYSSTLQMARPIQEAINRHPRAAPRRAAPKSFLASLFNL